jgi:hypothetical protein
MLVDLQAPLALMPRDQRIWASNMLCAVRTVSIWCWRKWGRMCWAIPASRALLPVPKSPLLKIALEPSASGRPNSRDHRAGEPWDQGTTVPAACPRDARVIVILRAIHFSRMIPTSGTGGPRFCPPRRASRESWCIIPYGARCCRLLCARVSRDTGREDEEKNSDETNPPKYRKSFYLKDLWRTWRRRTNPPGGVIRDRSVGRRARGLGTAGYPTARREARLPGTRRVLT